jgi:hypothetical protein
VLYKKFKAFKERKILKNLSRESIPKKEAQILFNRVNQEALQREFISQSIPFETQPVIGIKYKGQILDKKYQPDFICYDEVIARPPRPPASLCLAGGRA